ncbi:hypothetical protein [Solirubrobacter soli]|uniref:hypothetical protein n=1 Tax=Solirubrobacter soli TaxID=363832 RepID=UPI000412514F|nr:hypothetical protein [Solirubrobacter soli]
MKASELSEAAAGRRTAVVAALRSAGWRCDSWEELFAAGFSLSPEAYCELPAEGREIGIGYVAEADYLTLKFESSDDEQIVLRLYPERDAGELAAALAREVEAAQTSDEGQQLAGIVERLRPLCRRQELETADEILEIE